MNRVCKNHHLVALACCIVGAIAALAHPRSALAVDSLADAVGDHQAKMVKIYGAGGLSGLEAYQSGFLISATGHLLTVRSYVLDTDYIGVTASDGRKFEAKLVGADPRLELAVLKIESDDLPYFDLATSVPADGGTRVLALSNLFGVATGDEPDSVQHGVITVKTRLDARRGAFATPYRGTVYVLDAMTNNPGAAGGALVNLHGELLGMLGKELRSSQSNIWLNFAIPIEDLRETVDAIVAGKFSPGQDTPDGRPQQAVDAAALGLVLVPDELERTPPYVDQVRPGSAAEAAGLRPDDLIVFVGQNLVPSCKGFFDELARIERDTPLKLVLMRGDELVEVEIRPPAEAREP
jgi:S1-C subfamily serine protease